MQESRSFQIVYHLLDKGHTTAPELAEKLEVSVRTIYRDIDALSGAGIPIYAETGRKGGIHLLHDFVLDKAVLSKDEKQEILTALQSMNTTQGIHNSQTLQKLSGLFHLDSENWLEVDFSRWGSKDLDNKKFNALKSAIIHCQSVQIRYASSYEEISERIVQPTKLVYKSKAWYLKAFCTEKQAFRTFKLTRIIDFELLNEHFTHQNSIEPDSMDTLSEENYPLITLRFPKELAYRVYDEFNPTQVQHQEDGCFIVSTRMPEDSWLVGFLLSFGPQVEILSPTSLREIVAEQAKLVYIKNKP